MTTKKTISNIVTKLCRNSDLSEKKRSQTHKQEIIETKKHKKQTRQKEIDIKVKIN